MLMMILFLSTAEVMSQGDRVSCVHAVDSSEKSNNSKNIFCADGTYEKAEEVCKRTARHEIVCRVTYMAGPRDCEITYLKKDGSIGRKRNDRPGVGTSCGGKEVYMDDSEPQKIKEISIEQLINDNPGSITN